MSELLANRKIELEHAFTLFSKYRNLTREEVLVADYSFSSYETIETTFTTLIGRNFTIEITKFAKENPSNDFFLLDHKVDWKQIIRDMFEVRNKIIHEQFSDPIKKTDYKLFRETTFDFMVTAESYFQMRNDDK